MIQQKLTNGPQKPQNEPRSNNGSQMSQYGSKTGPLVHTGRAQLQGESKRAQGRSTLEKKKNIHKREYNSTYSSGRTMQEWRVHRHGYHPMDSRSCMHKCKPKFTLHLPVNMNGLTGGGAVARNE